MHEGELRPSTSDVAAGESGGPCARDRGDGGAVRAAADYRVSVARVDLWPLRGGDARRASIDGGHLHRGLLAEPVDDVGSGPERGRVDVALDSVSAAVAAPRRPLAICSITQPWTPTCVGLPNACS